MPTKSRALTLDDIAAVIALSNEQPDRQRIYKAVEAIAAETCGWVLLTTLRHDVARQAVVRLHSSDEKAYPVGGSKPLDKLTENHTIMERGDVALAATSADIKRMFFDHELIFSLGITAIMNVPIRHAGRRLGTLNFCGEEGNYREREMQIGHVLAGLLAPALLKAVDG